MHERFPPDRQVRVHHQVEPLKVEAACREVGRHAHPHPPRA
jgi:hypothetical protein